MVVKTDAKIVRLPGFGTRDQVSLCEFVRGDVDTLSPSSWIRSHARFASRFGIVTTGYDEEAVCGVCAKDVYAMGGHAPTDAVAPALEYVRVVSRDKKLGGRKNAFWFCFDCALDRDAMVKVVKRSKAFTNTVAADGQDVYAFIAQTIKEDRMGKTASGENLTLHAGIDFNPTGNNAGYRTMIGGRIAYDEQVTQMRNTIANAQTVAAKQKMLKKKEEAEAKAAAKTEPTQ